MWNIVLSVAPVLISLISLVVHFFVFHRLKCTKDLSSCVKDDLRKIYLELRALLLLPSNLVADLSEEDVASISVATYRDLISRLERVEKVIDILEDLRHGNSN